MNTMPVTMPPAISPVQGLLRGAGGVWRLTYPAFFAPRRLLVLAGLVALLCLLTSQMVRTGKSQHFYSWTCVAYLMLLLPVVATFTAAGASREDMTSVTVDYALTRSMRRVVYSVFRWFSQMLCLQLASLAAFAALMGIGWNEQVDRLPAMIPILLAAQVLVITGFTALGYLFGSMTSRYLVVSLIYGGAIEVGVGNIPTQISRLSVIHHIKALLAPSLPHVGGATEAESLGAAVGAIALFALVAVGIAAVRFAQSEFTGAGAVEK